MNKTKKVLAVVLAFVLSLSLLPANNVSAASKKVKLNKTKATVYVGKTVTLKLKNNKKKVKWSSSNKKVATVSKKGKVKGKKIGKAIITAKVGKKKYKCKITVKKNTTPKPTVKPTERATTKPVEQSTTKQEQESTTKPEEQPTTEPTEQTTTEPDIEENDEWTIEEVENGVRILEYCGTNSDIVIPSEIQGKRVVEIASGAFSDNPSNLTSVIIPEGVTSIEDQLFEYCSNLTSVTIPKSVTTIGDFAFSECVSLKKIDMPEGLTHIGECAFNGCRSLESITIQKGITNIGYGVFSGCGTLTSLVIPESVTSIDYAFEGTYIQKENLINNSSIEVIEGLTFYDEIINGLYIRDNTAIGIIDNEATEVVIPEGVTSIGESAFLGCSSLESVTIPKGVTSIGDGAFSGIVIQSSKFINNSDLKGDEANYWGATVYDQIVNELYIRDNEVIGICNEEATDVLIPEGVTSIGEYAFASSYSLESVTIPKSVTDIGFEAFDSIVTIQGEAGSYVETWAKENGYAFVAE